MTTKNFCDYCDALLGNPGWYAFEVPNPRAEADRNPTILRDACLKCARKGAKYGILVRFGTPPPLEKKS